MIVDSAPETGPEVERTVRKLLSYCQRNQWAGYDPYDALNSKMFNAIPFLNSRIARLVLTQGLKRSPINCRRVLLVPKTQNPKAISLFLSALLKLSRIGISKHEDQVGMMIKRLVELRSRDVPYWCWGYSFPWQTRTILVPAGAPNLVCTAFVANGLLDAYEVRRDSRCLNMAVSSGEFLLNELYWSSGDSVAGFAYPLSSQRHQVHNANFLAAALLARLYKHTGENRFLAPALAAARCSAAKQYPDGSWIYSEAANYEWVDNFHTGYNLCALKSISRDAGTAEFDSHLRRGFEFYRAHFFREDGAARYFHNRTYPIDIHCVAQSIITLLLLKDLDEGNVALAESVFRWAKDHMWDDKGFFYYRILRFWRVKTSYMRWSQAWMLLALVKLMEDSKCDVSDRKPMQIVRAAQTA
jgi:hypothetical protein